MIEKWSVREMKCMDMCKWNNVNLDPFTENFTVSFYLGYMLRWPEWCLTAETPDGRIAGYILGKVEGHGDEWHSHVSAVTVASEFRRMGVAAKLMDVFEAQSVDQKCVFADLYVRVSNEPAVKMYASRGYVVYRRVLHYYADGEDAYDMRKPLPADPEKKCIAGGPLTVQPEELPEYDDY